MRILWGISLLALPLMAVADAEDYPRTASLKSNEVNVRAGPGVRYPILWVFRRDDWPVQLLAKYDNWYKIRDLEGEEGWVYIGLVQGRPTAVVNTPITMYADKAQERPVYRLESGVVVQLPQSTCGAALCAIEVRGRDGYVPTKDLAYFSEAEVAETTSPTTP